MVRDELVQLTEGARELRLVPPANRSRMLEILAQAIVEHTPSF